MYQHIMQKAFTVIIAFLVLLYGENGTFANTQTIELPKCIIKAHCARVNLEVKDLNDSFQRITEVIENTPRITVVERSDSFIHAEVKTKLMHFIDDLEVKAIPKYGILQVRSESRVGFGDMGVNKKRIESLANELNKVEQIQN